MATREYADISALLGNHGDATWANGLWERVRAGFEMFWDERRGTYLDHIVQGTPQAATSQAAAAAAIVSGLAPAHRRQRIVDRIMDPDRLVTRSWIGGDGGYDERNMLPPDHQRILTAVRQSAGPVMARQVGEILGFDVTVRAKLEPLRGRPSSAPTPPTRPASCAPCSF